MAFSLNLKFGDLVGSAKKMFQKDESVMGIDIGSAFIKVVQVRKEGGRAVLETYGELALGPYAGTEVGLATNLPTEKIVEAGKDIFREANVTAKVGSVSLPLSSALLALMEIPEMEEEKLAKIIPIEARKYIPVPISEVSLDWVVLPKPILAPEEEGFPGEGGEKSDDGGGGGSGGKERKKIKVMMVAIHNEVLKKYQDIVSGLGIERPSFEIEVYSSIRATIGRDMTPIMFMDLGAGLTKLSLVEQGIISNVHIVSRGSQEITQALAHALGVGIVKAEGLKREIGLVGKTPETEKVSLLIESAIGSVFAETNRVLLNYQNKYHRNISKVVLTGGGALLKGLPEYAEKSLDAEAVFGDSFAKLQAPAFLAPVLKDAGPEFSVAIGLALKKLQEEA